MTYNDGFTLGLYGFVAAAFAGFKSPIGAVIGGFALGITISLAVGIDWGPFTSQYKDIVAMTLFLIILVLRSNRLAAEERAS
jgi:branched-chain amino acid transport system permease protein